MKLRGLYRVERTGVWYYQPPMSKGIRPKAISLGTKDEAEAVKAYYAMLAQAEETFRRGSIRMEAARYVKAMRDSGKHRPATTEHSERVLGQLIDLVNNLPVDRITTGHLAEVKRQWQARGLTEATILSYFTRIAAFFGWAVREGLTKVDPVEGLHYERKVATKADHYCTKEQRDALVAGAPLSAEQLEGLCETAFLGGHYRPQLLRIDLALCLWLGFFAGLRRNEIVEARRDWVDLVAGVLHVRATDTFVPKGKQKRLIRMSPRLRAFLAYYVETVDFGEDHGAAYLLRPDRPQGRKQLTRGKKAWRYRWDPRAPFEAHVTARELPWVDFHTMRHTFGTLHALAGTPLSTIARELGDQLRVVEKTYIGYTKSDSHSAAAD
jgi:integrase